MTRHLLAALFVLLLAGAANAQTIGAGQCCSCAAAVCTDFNLSIGQPCIAPCTIHNNAICSDLVTPGATCLDETPTPTNTSTPTRTFTVTPTNTPTAVAPTVTPTRTVTPTATLTPTAVATDTSAPVNTATVTPTFTVTKTPSKTRTPTSTRLPTSTFTPVKTATITPLPTNTAGPTSTPTFGPNVDFYNVANSSLQNRACPTPPCSGTPVPCRSGHITASCTTYAGTATAQLYGIPHLGPWQGTPVPIGTPITCPGRVGFDDNYDQCYWEISTCGSSCTVGAWIDRAMPPWAVWWHR